MPDLASNVSEIPVAKYGAFVSHPPPPVVGQEARHGVTENGGAAAREPTGEAPDRRDRMSVNARPPPGRRRLCLRGEPHRGKPHGHPLRLRRPFSISIPARIGGEVVVPPGQPALHTRARSPPRREEGTRSQAGPHPVFDLLVAPGPAGRFQRTRPVPGRNEDHACGAIGRIREQVTPGSDPRFWGVVGVSRSRPPEIDDDADAHLAHAQPQLPPDVVDRRSHDLASARPDRIGRFDDQCRPRLIALAPPCELRLELPSIPRQPQHQVGGPPLVRERLGAQAYRGRLRLTVAGHGDGRRPPRGDVAHGDHAARGEDSSEPPLQLTRHLELPRPHAANRAVQPSAIQTPSRGSETGVGRAARIPARQRASSESTPTPPASASRSAMDRPALATRRWYAARPPTCNATLISVARAWYVNGRGRAPGGTDRSSWVQAESLPLAHAWSIASCGPRLK